MKKEQYIFYSIYGYILFSEKKTIFLRNSATDTNIFLIDILISTQVNHNLCLIFFMFVMVIDHVCFAF